MKTTKEVTVGDLVKALKKNGYEQAFGSYIIYDENLKIKAACAIGQAALNLEVRPEDLNNAYYRGEYLLDIVQLNDYDRLDVPTIGKRLEKWCEENEIPLTKPLGVMGIVERS